ncbi:hypothetical protein P2R15_24120 [Escherichia coli]|uniref:hypothetical protein n=2 Tax=Escherichia coli TaxID=562 RepID=UPI00301C81CE
MAELIFSALRILGAMWMVATFIVVASSFVRLVGEGKDMVGVLFGSIFLWVIIGVMPVAVAKMAWRFVSLNRPGNPGD